MPTIRIKLYKGKKLSDGRMPVVMQLSVNSKVARISLGCGFYQKEWNSRLNQPKNPEKWWFDLIEKSRSKALEARFNLEAQNRFSLSEWKREISNETRNIEFFSFAKSHISSLEANGKIGNANFYKSNTHVFQVFLMKDKILFSEIDPNLLEKYSRYLKLKKLSPVTIHGYLRTIRALFNKARQQGVIAWEMYPFHRFKLGTATPIKNIPILSANEMSQIFQYEPTTDKERLALDTFKFAFYCWGISPIDMFMAKRTQLDGNIFKYKRCKTHKNYTILLPIQAIDLLDQYSGKMLFPWIEDTDDYNTIVKKISYLRKPLKRISTELGINFTYYSARKTWASIARELGYPRDLIKQGLGHAYDDVTEVYLSPFPLSDLEEMNNDIQRKVESFII